MQSYNPGAARHPGLGSSLFARHYSGNHVCFLFLQVLRCFSSLGWLSLRSNTPSVCWVVPFGNLRIYRSCAAPRSLSQLTTSFIVSQSQGIHHTPLSALKELLLLLISFFTTYYPNMSKNLTVPISHRLAMKNQLIPMMISRIRSGWSSTTTDPIMLIKELLILQHLSCWIDTWSDVDPSRFELLTPTLSV